MESSNRRAGQLIAGTGGVLLIASLFLPWAERGGVSRTGWELWTMSDVFFLIAGLCAIAAAIPNSPAIRKKTSDIVKSSQPLRLTPWGLSAHGRNKDTISSTPPPPASSRPNPGFTVLMVLLS